MITDVKYSKFAPRVIGQLHRTGAFLTTRREGQVNTMTIGWGSIGRLWSQPVFTVLVRHNRYTYELVQGADDFTVSVPLDRDLDQQLEFCGSNSGREQDKYKSCGLDLLAGRTVASPVVAQCPLHYECKIIYAQAMELEALDSQLRQRYYGGEPPHTMYYGNILACYLTGEVQGIG